MKEAGWSRRASRVLSIPRCTELSKSMEEEDGSSCSTVELEWDHLNARLLRGNSRGAVFT